MKRILLIAGAGTVLVSGMLFGARSSSPSLITPAPQPVKIILTGDVMLDRGIEYMVGKYGNGNFEFPFLKIAGYLKGADVVFGNLEGPISDKGTNMGSIYSFRAEPKAIEGLAFASFNAVSLANNHSFDYGSAALEDTFSRLKAAGIDYATDGHPAVFEIRGEKIAFLAYSAFGPDQISENDFERISKEIKTAKENGNIAIVSLHAGEEYQNTPNWFQTDFFKMARDAGADFVFGHHPHVIQPDFYSLGNFIFDQGFSEETMSGQIVEISVESGKIKKTSVREIKMNNFFQPELKI